MAKFKLLCGLHSEGKNEDGSPKIYRKGDIVDSASNLLKCNSPGSIKFEQVSDDTPKVENISNELLAELKLKSIPQLREFIEASELEIDTSTMRKHEIVQAISNALDEA